MPRFLFQLEFTYSSNENILTVGQNNFGNKIHTIFVSFQKAKEQFPTLEVCEKKESQIIIMSSFCSNCFHFRFSEAGFGEKIDQISHNGAKKPKICCTTIWQVRVLRHGLLNRWMLQLDLGSTTGGLERAVSVHNST